METKGYENLLERIGNVFERANECKLDAGFLESIDCELTALSGYFGTTNMQSLLLATIFGLNCKGNTVNVKELIEYYECNPMRMMKHSADLEWLYKNGFLIREKTRRRVNLTLMNYEFTVNEKLSDAIIQGQPNPTIKRETLSDTFEVLGSINQMLTDRAENEECTHEMFMNVARQMTDYQHFPL